MAFEANNFNVARKVVLPKSEVNVECNISITDEITKVLSVSAETCVSGSEVLNGVINYSAYADVCIVYLNNEGEIGKVNSTCPFSSKISKESIKNGQKAVINLKVSDCSVESASGDNVKAVCNIEEETFVVENVEVKSVKSSDEDVCCAEEVINVNRFIGEANDTAEITSELSLREPIKRVILTESQVLLKSVESGSNFVSISGEVVSRVLYLTENDKFEAGYIYENFKQELELEGATRESEVEAHACIKRDSVKVSLEQEEKGGKIILEIPVALSVKAYEKVEALVVKDLYSTQNDLKITTMSFDMTCVCPASVIESKIDGSLTLGDDRPRVDKIMFVGGNSVVVTNSFLSNGEITIEGIARTSVVYLNDEDSSLNSVALEVPFVITDKFDVENEGGTLNISAIVCDVDVAVKRGRELFYDAKIKAYVNYSCDEVSGVISEVEAVEAYAEKDYGMELVFAKAGQTSWDIAKEARVKEDLLLAQNPEVVFPLQDDEKLVLFYQKVNG